MQQYTCVCVDVWEEEMAHGFQSCELDRNAVPALSSLWINMCVQGRIGCISSGVSALGEDLS